MNEAFSFERGINEGEFLKHQNPKYWRMVEEAQGKVEAAKPKRKR